MTSLSPIRWSGYESSESYSDATTEPEPAAVLSEPGDRQPPLSHNRIDLGKT